MKKNPGKAPEAENPEAFFPDPDPESCTREEVCALLRRAQAEYDRLLGEDPGEDSEEYPDWLDRLEEMDDRMDGLQDLLEEMEDAGAGRP